MTQRKMVANAIRAIRAHKKLAKDAKMLALSYTGDLRAFHDRRARKLARIARIEFDSLY